MSDRVNNPVFKQFIDHRIPLTGLLITVGGYTGSSKDIQTAHVPGGISIGNSIGVSLTRRVKAPLGEERDSAPWRLLRLLTKHDSVYLRAINYGLGVVPPYSDVNYTLSTTPNITGPENADFWTAHWAQQKRSMGLVYPLSPSTLVESSRYQPLRAFWAMVSGMLAGGAVDVDWAIEQACVGLEQMVQRRGRVNFFNFFD